MTLPSEPIHQEEPAPQTSRPPCCRRRIFAITLITLALLAGVAWWAKGRGIKYWAIGLVRPHTFVPPRPQIITTRPGDFETKVALNTRITAKVKLSGGPLVAATVNTSTVALLRTGDQSRVPATVAYANGKIVLTPATPLEPNTDYSLHITEQLKDVNGGAVVPADFSFTTAGHADPLIRFEKVKLAPTEGTGFTCVQMGPDHKLYAGSDDGRIFRFDIAADGTLGSPRIFTSLQSASGGPRLLTGFCFDPASTPQYPIIWAAHGYFAFKDAPDWTCKITRLAGPDLEDVRDAVVGLPRSIRDHLTNQPVFGPDGALYFNQGSNSAWGAPDVGWGNRPERLLSSAILRLDVSKLPLNQPLDVRTGEGGGSYDPKAPGAPLTIYAYGIRVVYDLVWASNGQLYAPTNGSSAGGNAPSGRGAPVLHDIVATEDDWLNRIVAGKYYGHPNPMQRHYAINGGNPTRGVDYGEVCDYPAGTKPDPKWQRPVYDFGRHVSANGVIEYVGNAFGGKLDHWLLVCRYNVGSDLIALHVAPDGGIDAAMTGIIGLTRFQNPLDLTEDTRTGSIYVSEYGAQRITLLRPSHVAISGSP